MRNDDAMYKAGVASVDAAGAKRDVTDLEQDVARLRLVCAAMWELLKEKAALKEEDLFAKIAEVDARDGVIDGKLIRAVRMCKECGRKLPAKQNKCMYCKTVTPPGNVFESV